jgi:hypothetical protein
MAISIKKTVLWRPDLDNSPGALARVLEPLARSGVDLQVCMGYRVPGQESRAVVELAPVTGGRAVKAARAAGLSEATEIPTLLVTGDNRAGLGHDLARAIAAEGINLAFLMALVVGKRHSSVIGFEKEADAKAAARLIKKASAPPKKAARKKARRKK